MSKSIGGFVGIILLFVLIVNGSINISGASLTVWRFFSGGINAALGEDKKPISVNVTVPESGKKEPQSGYTIP